MSIANFIPEIWSKLVLDNIEKNLVFGAVCNRDYEGEIKAAGDTVRINEIGDVTISSYTKSGTGVSPEELTDAQRLLLINQTPSFAFFIDDIDRAQGNPAVMQKAVQNAAYGVRNFIDQYVAGLYTDAALTTNLGTEGSPIALNNVNVMTYLAKIARTLDDASVPEEGRWIVVPPWVKEKIAVKAPTLAGVNSDALARNGLLGNWFGLNVYVSNNTKWTTNNYTKNKIMAGGKSAITLAVQKEPTVEAYRPEARFADAIKGLCLFGAKVVKPTQLALMIATDTADA
jgi:hypothetical protein